MISYWLISAVFVGGVIFKLLKLPPLVGFLAAGFALNAYGIEHSAMLESIADIGVTLLLFTIGLKINLPSLLKAEVLLSSSLQTVLFILGFIVVAEALVLLGASYFSSLTLQQIFYIGLALSFSSTVCAVKILEEKNELKSRHGQITLNVLVIQDVIAVLFLATLAGQVPSYWALLLLLLPLLKKPLSLLLSKVDHGELLPLAGIFLALSGAELFHAVGMKADLGALLLGMLLSHDKKATELAKSLLVFKDVFLAAFFLSIGLKTLPSEGTFVVALCLLLLVFVKQTIFFFSFILCKLRVRNAFLASLALGNFSEFGLIVSVVAHREGWITDDWLLIIAIVVSLSFVLTSIINNHAHTLYAKYSSWLKGFQRQSALTEDIFHQPTSAEILVVGMGRVGRGAYDALQRYNKGVVWGIDSYIRHVESLQKQGYLVSMGDAEDVDFWEQVDLSYIKVIMLAMPSHEDMLESVKRISAKNYTGKIAGIAKYEDQRQELLAMGVDVAFNFYAEAGAGFAEESLHLLELHPMASV